jgi:hypothetical protein
MKLATLLPKSMPVHTAYALAKHQDHAHLLIHKRTKRLLITHLPPGKDWEPVYKEHSYASH